MPVICLNHGTQDTFEIPNTKNWHPDCPCYLCLLYALTRWSSGLSFHHFLHSSPFNPLNATFNGVSCTSGWFYTLALCLPLSFPLTYTPKGSVCIFRLMAESSSSFFLQALFLANCILITSLLFCRIDYKLLGQLFSPYKLVPKSLSYFVIRTTLPQCIMNGLSVVQTLSVWL